MSCLYILEINALSVASFANIFSHSEGCLFVLFMVSFAVQKLLSFIRSHLFIFVLYVYFVYLFTFGCIGSCCMWAFSSCSKQGLLFFAVRRLLIAVASLVAEHGL